MSISTISLILLFFLLKYIFGVTDSLDDNFILTLFFVIYVALGVLLGYVIAFRIREQRKLDYWDGFLAKKDKKFFPLRGSEF